MHVDEEDKTTALIQGSGSNYKSNAVLVNETGFTEGEDYCSFLSDRVDGFPGKPGQGATLLGVWQKKFVCCSKTRKVNKRDSISFSFKTIFNFASLEDSWLLKHLDGKL